MRYNAFLGGMTINYDKYSMDNQILACTCIWIITISSGPNLTIGLHGEEIVVVTYRIILNLSSWHWNKEKNSNSYVYSNINGAVNIPS